jgi:hypothetical protein
MKIEIGRCGRRRCSWRLLVVRVHGVLSMSDYSFILSSFAQELGFPASTIGFPPFGEAFNFYLDFEISQYCWLKSNPFLL